MKVTFEMTPRKRREFAKAGQIRANDDGRVIQVIIAQRFEESKGYVDPVYKALVLREYENGACQPFETVPAEYRTDYEIAKYYPILLDGKITIYDDVGVSK